MAVTTQPREDRARFALKNSGQWLRIKTKTGKVVAFGFPSLSQPGLIHMANRSKCDCKDRTIRGVDCYHILAVRLFVERAQAQRAAS